MATPPRLRFRDRPILSSLNHRLQRRRNQTVMDYTRDIPGSMPGTLRILEDAHPPEMVLIDYGNQHYEQLQVQHPEELLPHLDSESVSWVDLKGLGDEAVIQRLGQVFELHPLALEDIVNVPQRPKIEEYEDQLLIITRMVILQSNHTSEFFTEQVSLILGPHYLLTVQEEPEYDCFNPVRDRIRLAKGLIRRQGADYLTYALLDAIIDGFFPVLEVYGEKLELLEDEVVANPTPKTLEKIHKIKRELITLRRAIWPQRDAISALIRDGNDLISEEVRIYLRDCYDHAVQVLDIVETYREVASSLMDVYLSSVGNRMNEIMKFLTVMSSIFIPLTFIAGVYGMNFDNMPEVKTRYGYFVCLAAMGITATVLLILFWRRGWFQNYAKTPPSQDSWDR